MELRCDSGILHGVLEGELVEVVCRSNRCGKKSGVIVLHTFNTTTGKLVSTRRFLQPEKEVNPDGTS